MGVMNNFWRGKRVFITGHTGFKGSWLTTYLKMVGANVCGFSLPPPTTPNLFELANVAQGILSFEGDIRNVDCLKAAVKDFQPEFIFHLAAQALVRESYADPVNTYSTNVMGTINLLEAVRAVSSVVTVIIVTSDKCYENREWQWGYRENEAMGGFDPYSSSKGCVELLSAAYQRSYFSDNSHLSLSTVRAGNVIGGGDWAIDRLIPDLCNALTQGKPATIRNPNAIRPWQHVLEPLSGYLVLAEKSSQHPQQFIGGWNFGADYQDSKPVSWIADKVIKFWGKGAHWITENSEHPHEAETLRLDCSKARTLLNWSPRLTLSKSIEYTVNWYQAYIKNRDMEYYTQQQILSYINGDDL